MYVGVWRLLGAATIAGKWSAKASSVCCRHVTHFSSPWERSVSLPITTSGSQGEIWLFLKRTGVVLLYHRFLLCSFRQFLSDFLRYPTDCFSRNPLALIEHDQKHLAVVYSVKNCTERGLSLATTLLITLHIISATNSAVCFSYWCAKLATGAREGMWTHSAPLPAGSLFFCSPSNAVTVSPVTMSTPLEGHES